MQNILRILMVIFLHHQKTLVSLVKVYSYMDMVNWLHSYSYYIYAFTQCNAIMREIMVHEGSTSNRSFPSKLFALLYFLVHSYSLEEYYSSYAMVCGVHRRRNRGGQGGSCPPPPTFRRGGHCPPPPKIQA